VAEDFIPAPPVAAAAPPRAPSFGASAMRVFDLSIGQMLWSRRTIFLALVVGAPVVLAVIIRVLASAGIAGGVRMGGAPVVSGPSIFGLFIWILYLRFIVPVLGVFYGTSLIADEVEDRTITYLFTRPIPKGSVLVGKFLAYLACTTMVVLPSVMLVFFLVVPRGGSLAATFPSLVADLGILFLGLAVYGALFACVGAWLKRPVLTGLLFVFGWEPVILVVPGYLKKFSVAYYLQALVPHSMPADNSAASLLTSLFRESPSLPVALVMLAVLGAGFLFLATRLVDRKEYVLEQ
jgi:ABC-type transport system involved in multi-copper enzyme maturation permease subunit